MPSDLKTASRHYRRYLRFIRYLPVQCTILYPEQLQSQAIAGRTRCVNAGGLELLLPQPWPVKTLLSIQISGGAPLRGRIVSVSKAIPTLLGNRFAHGVAFEDSVDPSLVRQWVSRARQRAHARAPVQFDVEYTLAGKATHGTCVNLSRGGMFIATEQPAAPETEVSLRFTPPTLSRPLSIGARIVWCSRGRESGAVTGMGVKFIAAEPSAIGTIDSLVDRLRRQGSAPPEPPTD
jgi:uncharacterized protein (TIGR02266 family)